jgi:hypothetical protein
MPTAILSPNLFIYNNLGEYFGSSHSKRYVSSIYDILWYHFIYIKFTNMKHFVLKQIYETLCPSTQSCLLHGIWQTDVWCQEK